jgi:hypothetical protein
VIKPVESLRGYLLRLDEENGAPHFQPSLSSLGYASSILSDISAATMRSTDCLRTRVFQQPRNEDDGVEVCMYTRQFPGNLIRHGRKHFCPECLAQTGYMRMEWECTLVNSCWIHKKALLYRCTICLEPQRWLRGKLFHCSCCADLRTMISAEIPRMSMLLDALVTELISPPERERDELLSAELQDILFCDDDEILYGLEFVYDTLCLHIDAQSDELVRQWLSPLWYAARQQLGRSFIDQKRAKEARARCIDRELQSKNPVCKFLTVRASTSAECDEWLSLHDAETEALETQLFQTILTSYRRNPELTNVLFWRRWDWFIHRLQFIKK